MRAAIRSLWDEPRAEHPPARVWRDWALVAVLAPVAVLETVLRDDLAWRPLGLALAVVALLALLWRRTHPLAMVAAGFGAHTLSEFAPHVGADSPAGLYASASVLVLPYALLRWGSGRAAALGIAIVLSSHALTWAARSGDPAELLLASVFLLFPAALGAAVRYRTASRLRALDQIKLREREQLARGLHDTVAHHVSAIAIQAQAGRTVAAADPGAALDALKAIEAEASRALEEMRAMVGSLRRGEEPDLAPAPGVRQIERLARWTGDAPSVDVRLSGDLEDLTPSVDAALYRLAQEAITNAVRHARRATSIRVSVAGERDCVRLTISDDGEVSVFGPRASTGFGLVGMTERAALLGGTFQAGPGPVKGWTVVTVLPRRGGSR